jgi:hypothetical protein
MTGIFNTMRVDQAMRFVSAHQEGKNRRLSDGETIVRGEHKYVLQDEAVLLAGVVCKLAAFPAANPFPLDSGPDEGGALGASSQMLFYPSRRRI